MIFRGEATRAGAAIVPRSVETYEQWECGDRMDLAAMGRAWYLEAWARARMGDAAGLTDSIRRVCKAGRDSGYYWRERYNDNGGYGVTQYCEYPANLIRIVQRFLLGVDLRLDGALVLAPTVTEDFWDKGFGQTLASDSQPCRFEIAREPGGR